MKIKLDENLPTELVQIFRSQTHDVHTVPTEALAGRKDAEVFAAAMLKIAC